MQFRDDHDIARDSDWATPTDSTSQAQHEAMKLKALSRVELGQQPVNGGGFAEQEYTSGNANTDRGLPAGSTGPNNNPRELPSGELNPDAEY